MDGLEVVPEQHKAGKYDSGLEVAPEQYKYDSGLEVAPHTEKEVQRDTAGLHYVSGPTGANPGIIEDGSAVTKPPRKRICGLSSTVFWVLIVIVAIVVTGAAVGGGVGSTVSKKTTPYVNLRPRLPFSLLGYISPNMHAIAAITAPSQVTRPLPHLPRQTRHLPRPPAMLHQEQ
jgi:hypothetical protein